MSNFDLPPPLFPNSKLPDLISSPTFIPPPVETTTCMKGCYPPPDQQQVNPGQLTMMMECTSLDTPLPSSSSTNDCITSSSSPYNGCQTVIQSAQLQDMGITPSAVVEEVYKIMTTETDKVVLNNYVIFLYTQSIDSVRGGEFCQAMLNSPILNQLYHVLLNDQDPVLLCYATGNLNSLSYYEEGRAAILGCNDPQPGSARGVKSLIQSLQSSDSNVVMFAITAIHNLLLDHQLQTLAKVQIGDGLKFIVRLLDCSVHNYEFKTTRTVLNCLQILSYGNNNNKRIIQQSGGPALLLRLIQENFYNPSIQLIQEELIDTASRVLKSLSACPINKIDIINNGGVGILTECIGSKNHEIIKTCLWTLRNLSDEINKSKLEHQCIYKLVNKLLYFLAQYSGELCITALALGTLANLTCNNESIKQLICTTLIPTYSGQCTGINVLLNVVKTALGDNQDSREVDQEIYEPAVCALCHLMNQRHNQKLADEVKLQVHHEAYLFQMIVYPKRGIKNDDLDKAVKKLSDLAGFSI